jgi:hypothetical protein
VAGADVGSLEELLSPTFLMMTMLATHLSPVPPGAADIARLVSGLETQLAPELTSGVYAAR